MNTKPREVDWRGRKGRAWLLLATAWVAMTVGLFLPSYGDAGLGYPDQSYPGWDCAWTVTWIWGNVIENGFADLNYGESLMLSYLPINALFVIAALFLWFTGRTRRVGWVFRFVYSLIVAQVLAWWVLHQFEQNSGAILIGYWFWLAAYALLAVAFWVMPLSKPALDGDPGGGAPS